MHNVCVCACRGVHVFEHVCAYVYMLVSWFFFFLLMIFQIDHNVHNYSTFLPIVVPYVISASDLPIRTVVKQNIFT